MARPRVFVSSTFYDLRQVRADLERFIYEMGYDPVLNERGVIPYGPDKRLEDYAYEEVGLADMLVAIIGGRFGTAAAAAPYSITQSEIRRALELHKPVHIFIERGVDAEYRTYILNKSVEGMRYHYADDARVFGFIEELRGLPNNNPIATFETAADIQNYLREQWAGIFQRLLQERRLLREVSLIENMQSTVATLNQLVTFLTEERRSNDNAIRDILLSNHPAFEALREAIGASYRLIFANREEMVAYLKARNWRLVDEPEWDDASHEEWIHDMTRRDRGSYQLLKIATSLFERDGSLRLLTAAEWSPDYIKKEVRSDTVRDIDPDDIPF